MQDDMESHREQQHSRGETYFKCPHLLLSSSLLDPSLAEPQQNTESQRNPFGYSNPLIPGTKKDRKRGKWRITSPEDFQLVSTQPDLCYKIDYSDCPAKDQWAQIKSKRTRKEISAVIKRITTTVAQARVLTKQMGRSGHIWRFLTWKSLAMTRGNFCSLQITPVHCSEIAEALKILIEGI